MTRALHLICNAHLDPVWLWEWEEGAAEALSTFRTAADFCEAFDGFVFNHNEALLYRWVEEYEPALFARIQRLVAQGKWHIMGGWYLQPDCNMPSGESFVRQILVGRRYFSEKFGVRPTTAINFDPFGHTRGLPQILVKSGYDSYMFCRPFQHDCPLPNDDFVWVGYDGSEITGHRTMNWYNAPLGRAREKVEQFAASYPDRPVSAVLWGVGDHGGGPSRKDLEDLRDLIQETTDTAIRHSTPEAYFADLRATGVELPRHERDINPWAVGCYTSQVRIKQQHRHLENELYALEKMASTAAMQGLLPYPKAELDEALRDLLFCEFHDILPGSSIQPVEQMSLRVLDHGLEIISRLKARTFFALAQGQPRAQEGQIPILVYNPHPFPVRAPVTCEFQLADQNWGDVFTQVTVMAGGIPVPSQVEKQLANINLDWRKRVVFEAELAPGQMSRFDCALELLPQKPPIQLAAHDGYIHIETESLDVLVNTATGLIDRYCVHGRDLVQPGAFQPVVMRDNEDPWGMLVRSYRDLEGRGELLQPAAGTQFSGVTRAQLPSVRVIEDGDVRAVVEVVFGYEHSTICQHYKVPKHGTELEIETRVHWNEKNRMLKLAIPTALPDARYLGQVAYGVGELPANGDEAVAQKWVAVVSEGHDLALTCINDGIYGSDFAEGELRLSLLRSPAYAGHPIGERDVVPQDRYTPRIDQGERLYRFWFNGGPVRERLDAIDREAVAHNETPFALSFFPHGSGVVPQPGLVLSDAVVQLSAFKQAEDGRGYIVRVFEPTGTTRHTTVLLPALGIEQSLDLAPFEVKTCYLDPVARTLTEVTLIEGF